MKIQFKHNKRSYFMALFLTLFVFGSSFLIPLHVTHGAEDDTEALSELCQSELGIFDKIGRAVEALDIRSTVRNALTDIPTGFAINVATGTNSKTLVRCVGHWNSEGDIPFSLAGDSAAAVAECVPTPEDVEYCDALTAGYTDTTVGPVSSGRGTLADGSLLMLTKNLDLVNKEPLPVNLAYFANKEMARVPFLGQTFAQSDTRYTGPFLDSVYIAWRVIALLATALIATVMAVIGLMIMTRKKINPQTTVTVQYAIPRVILALILIFASYAIGAFFSSATWMVRGWVDDIILGGPWAPGITGLMAYGFPLLVTIIFTVTLAMTGIGVFVGILGAGGLAFVFIIRLIVEFKTFLIYVRMLALIIMSPITFALGAFPGKESSTADWFKNMGAKALSILGMRLIITVTDLIVASVVATMMVESGGNLLTMMQTNTLQVILAPLLFPLILGFGYFQAMQLPKKLDTAILGKK